MYNMYFMLKITKLWYGGVEYYRERMAWWYEIWKGHGKCAGVESGKNYWGIE